MTYLILNLAFMSVVLLLVIILKKFYDFERLSIRALLFMIILTAIFDSILVGLGIVAYDYDKTIGIKIGLAPIEDFAYTIIAWVIVPAMWNIFGRKEETLSGKDK